jgi:ABC-2 type transport system permease protein
VYLDAYRQYWRINLLTMLEYRANVLMWFGFSVIYHASALLALWVTLTQFPSMNGWDFRQAAFMYALWMLGHALNNTIFFSVATVPEFIREGRFDRFLVRPLDPLFQAITVPQQIFPDEFILAIFTIVIATWYAGVHVDAVFLLYVPLVAAGGALIDLGIGLMLTTISFWVIRIDSLRWVFMSLEQEFSRYPIGIYQRGVRVVLAFILPFAFMNYFPATYLLHKAEDGFHLNPAVGLLTPFVGLAWTAASYAFWRVGIQHYQGTGS